MLVCSWMQIYKGIVSVKIQQKNQNLAVQKFLHKTFGMYLSNCNTKEKWLEDQKGTKWIFPQTYVVNEWPQTRQ